MKKILPILLVLVLGLVANRALLAPGLPPTHDGEYHIIRFWQFYRTLTDGQWYPRWQPDLNYGYGSPLSNYYYPLSNYLASLMHFIGISFINSLKLQMLIASFLGTIFMYLWSRMFWGKLGAIVSAVFYTYSPYFFLDIYIRGAVGEVLALGIFPAFLWSFTKLIIHKKAIFLPISATILALVILSNNILGLIFFTFSIFYASFLLFLEKKNRKPLIFQAIYINILSLGLSAIFWLPAMLERDFVFGLENFDYKKHFVEIYQLIFPSWGSGFSADLASQGLSFQIGIANLIAFALAILAVITKLKSRKINIQLKTGVFFLTCLLVAVFLMIKVSQPVWEAFPLLRYFQFPWRLLSLVIIFCPFLAGCLLYFWPKKILGLIFIGLAIVLGIGYSQPAYYHQRDDNYYTTRSNFIDGTNVPGNAFNTIWMNTELRREEKKFKLISDLAEKPGIYARDEGVKIGNKQEGSLEKHAKSDGFSESDVNMKKTPRFSAGMFIGEGDLSIDFIRATEYKFYTKSTQDTQVIVNTAYFPGWTVFIDKTKIEIGPNNDGLVSFPVPKGEHTIEVKMLNTPIRNLAQTLTIVSGIATLVLLLSHLRVRIEK